MGADSAHVGGLRESLRGNQAVRLCPWPGLPELSWSRRVHAAGWVGCRASRPLGVCPQIIAGHHESLLGSHNCLPACPPCRQLLVGVGRALLHPRMGGVDNSTATVLGSSSPLSALGHPLLSSAHRLLLRQQELLSGAPEQAGPWAGLPGPRVAGR